MNKYKTVAEFLQDQPADKLEQVNTLRALIMAAEPSLTEDIKWNAPNYNLHGEDRITFNVMNKEGLVKLVLHMGASKKEDKKAPPVLKDDKGLVDWSSDIRGAITFANSDDIAAKSADVTALIKDWLKLS